MVQTLDRINWFQGWIIIVMIFAGIAMLKHYADRSQEQIDVFKKDSAYQKALIRQDLARIEQKVDRNQLLFSETKCIVGTVDSWAASVEPNP